MGAGHRRVGPAPRDRRKAPSAPAKKPLLAYILRSGAVTYWPGAGGAGREATVNESPILVVDDDPCIRGLISEALDWEGYPVVTAANGAEALKVVETTPPALVVLDMQMPELDGPGFVRALRERGLRLPVLVLTAATNARRYASELNADGFIPKPFDLTQLLTTVEQLCESPLPPYLDSPGDGRYQAAS